MKKLIVEWEVEDGYLGHSPQKTVIDVENTLMDEGEWNELSKAEKQEIIEEIVKEDFEQKISFHIKNYGI
jgi:hypothetical protein